MEKILDEAGLKLRNPQSDALENVESILKRDEKKGIWLAAASPLGIDTDRDASILVFDYYSTSERGNRYLSESGVLVGTRVESRETFAALIVEPKPPADGYEDPAGDVPLPDMTLVQRYRIPLRERLEQLPWRAGTYLVDILFDPVISNRAEFKLTAGAAAAKDEEVAAFIEARKSARGKAAEPYPAPSGGKYPNYSRGEKAIAIPEAEGIVLEAERVAVYEPDSHSVLKGSFRLSVPSMFYKNPEGGAATAVVPITLVITGNIMTGPFVVPLRIPAEDKVDPEAAESVMTGQFEIDLFGLEETSKVPQTYTIWAYSGTHRSEPVKAAFITPEMLL